MAVFVIYCLNGLINWWHQRLPMSGSELSWSQVRKWPLIASHSIGSSASLLSIFVHLHLPFVSIIKCQLAAIYCLIMTPSLPKRINSMLHNWASCQFVARMIIHCFAGPSRKLSLTVMKTHSRVDSRVSCRAQNRLSLTPVWAEWKRQSH